MERRKKLLLLVSGFKRGIKIVIKKITDIFPIIFNCQLSNTFVSVTQYGKCEQRNIPVEYTELDYIQSDGSQYIDLDTAINQDDVIEIEFEIIGAQSGTNIFGYRTSASSNNIMLFFGSTSNRVFIDFNNSNYADYRLSYDVSLNTRYMAIISKSLRAILAADGTVLAENTTVCPDTITCPSAYLFAAAGTPAYNYGSPCKVYSCRINGKRNLVGAKDASDAVEMYDKVSAAPFANAGTGSFMAGQNATPSPKRSIDLWCNNGRLYSGNIYDKTAMGEVKQVCLYNEGQVYFAAGNGGFIVPIEPNTTYTINPNPASGVDVTIFRIGTLDYVPWDATTLSPVAVNNYVKQTTPTPITFTSEANDRYLFIQVNLVLAASVANTLTVTTSDVRVRGTPEVLTVSGNIVEFNETRISNTTWAAADKSHGFEVYADIYGKSKGDTLLANRNAFGAFVPCAVGQSISIDFFDYTPSYGRCFYCEITADGKCNTEPVKYATNSGVKQKTFTLTQTDSIGFVIEWFISVSERDYTKENYAVCYGTTPLAAYQPYTPIQTVNDVSNLFAVGDYADTEEFIAGILTHKIGIKVLTGDNTKDGYWGTSAGASNLYSLTIADSSKDNTFSPISTHFVGVLGSVGYASIQNGQFKHGSNSNTYFFKDTSSADVDVFKAFLTEQYANGTPVIVLYPLATETTEQTTAHSLVTNIGQNIIDISANVDNIPGEIEYYDVAD